MRRVELLLIALAFVSASGRAAAQGKAATKAANTPAPQHTEQQNAREKALSGSKSAGQVKGAVKVEQDQEGVKSYTFGALELEGRLKSPQILYFMRRVRAEFDPRGLGHRSFLRELADTRRQRSVR